MAPSLIQTPSLALRTLVGQHACWRMGTGELGAGFLLRTHYDLVNPDSDCRLVNNERCYLGYRRGVGGGLKASGMEGHGCLGLGHGGLGSVRCTRRFLGNLALGLGRNTGPLLGILALLILCSFAWLR